MVDLPGLMRYCLLVIKLSNGNALSLDRLSEDNN